MPYHFSYFCNTSHFYNLFAGIHSIVSIKSHFCKHCTQKGNTNAWVKFLYNTARYRPTAMLWSTIKRYDCIKVNMFQNILYKNPVCSPNVLSHICCDRKGNFISWKNRFYFSVLFHPSNQKQRILYHKYIALQCFQWFLTNKKAEEALMSKKSAFCRQRLISCKPLTGRQKYKAEAPWNKILEAPAFPGRK